jgi:hypothetical protein
MSHFGKAIFFKNGPGSKFSAFTLFGTEFGIEGVREIAMIKFLNNMISELKREGLLLPISLFTVSLFLLLYELVNYLCVNI